MIILTVIAEQKIKEIIKSENIDTQIPETAGLKLKIKDGRLYGYLKSCPEINDKIVYPKDTNGIKFFIDTGIEEFIKEKPYKSIIIGWIGSLHGEKFIIEDLNKRYQYPRIRNKTIEKKWVQHD